MADQTEDSAEQLAELILRRTKAAARAIVESRELPNREFAPKGVDPDAAERLLYIRSIRTALAAARDAMNGVDNAAAAFEQALETREAVGSMRWSVFRSFGSLDARLSQLQEPKQRATEIERTVRAAYESSRFRQFLKRLDAIASPRRGGSEWTQAARDRAVAAGDALARIRCGFAANAPAAGDAEADWAAFRDNSAAVLEEAVVTADVLTRYNVGAWMRAANDLEEALEILAHVRRAVSQGPTPSDR